MDGKFIDLHVHTDHSDGLDSVYLVMERAKRNNVGIIALTEHYNLSSYREAKRCAKADIEVIPGIEIGADMSKYGKEKRHICHILGYFVSNGICTVLDEYEMNRYECVVETINWLQKRRINITLDDVIKNARDKKSIGRFDVAITLAYLGYAMTAQEAYGMYLDHKGRSYVKRKKLSPGELVKKIIEFGGVPVLAHPKSIHLDTETTKRFIEELTEAGLKGIEVYTPFNNDDQRTFYLDLCEKFDLIPTVGSDYHSLTRKPQVNIGTDINNNLCVTDDSIVKKLKLEKAKLDKQQGKGK